MSGAPDRLLVIFSDFEMGTGGPSDDYLDGAAFGELVASYANGRSGGLPIDLIFNGDTFELLKTSHDGGYPHLVSAEVALDKMGRVADAHAPFFEGLRAFLSTAGPAREVHFVAGNHDAELLFPEVQGLVRERCGGGAAVRFPGLEMEAGRVHVEHGSQLDPLFRMDPARPFITHRGRRLLNLSWGAVALLEVVIPINPVLYHLDRLRPKAVLFRLVPELKELLTTAFWSYWTRDFWRDYLRGDDPLKTVSVPMLRELAWRLTSWSADVALSDALERRMAATGRHDLCVVGHVHQPAHRSYGRRAVIHTGAMRDEFLLSEDGSAQTALPKTWAEVLLAGGEVAGARLVEQAAPPRPPGAQPESISAIRPRVRELLASLTAARAGTARLAQGA
ncbi:MAG TPA: hypothetical protein VHF22_05265 [Planctomycetota bacterium]|nr:hypothetical protein [Planctomycetota bacterium]